MKILSTRWYASDDCVGAGNPETYVCDCSWPMPIDSERDRVSVSEREESAAQVAAHIVRSHNWVLDLAEKQVPLDFLIEACDRVCQRKAMLTVALAVIADSGAEITDKQLKLIRQASALLKQAKALEEKNNAASH